MLTKVVNGVRSVMSDEEEAAIRAEWAENDRIQAERQAAEEAAKIESQRKCEKLKSKLNLTDEEIDFLMN
jgi:hypothetical protein